MDKKDFSTENIKKEIEKTGLPTEIRVTNFLKEANWMVSNEVPYIDYEENKVRTIDMTAFKVTAKYAKKIEDSIDASYELFIECKKFENQALVFHIDEEPLSFLSLKAHRLNLNKKEKTILGYIPLSYEQETIKYKMALSHQIIGGKDHLFDAYMQLIKALNHNDVKSAKKHAKGIPVEYFPIPVIVIDGAMFECYYEGKELKTPRTSFVRSIVNILPAQKIPAIIDIVEINKFPDYLKMILNSEKRTTEQAFKELLKEKFNK